MNGSVCVRYLVKFCLALLCACLFNAVHTGEKYPVDICYLLADLKYSAKQGVKICEVQQGCLSLFNGDSFRGTYEESIHTALVRTLALYNTNGWVVANTIADRNLVSALACSACWHRTKDIIELLRNPDFMHQAKQPVKDRYDCSSYQGFLYINWSQLYPIYDFQKRFPGMIVIDKSSFPFWIDKYTMTALFAQDELLATLKPRWGNYKKIYTKELAAQIAQDLHGDIFVIKPRGEFLGNGVIITKRENLDDVLFSIITTQGAADNDADLAYGVWQKDPFDSFIVEEFVASDPIRVPHLNNKLYQPTMRVAFLLVYHNQRHQVHFLGGYWKTPPVSLDDEGDLMDQNKDICEPPFYLAVDAHTMQMVQSQLSSALPLLHGKMLEFCANCPEEERHEPLKNSGVRIVLREVPLNG